jgi:hypothetical protein
MQFMTLERDLKPATVAARAYDLEGAGSPDARRRAEAALLQANPHVADLSVIPKGTTLVVPDVTGVEHNREAARASAPDLPLVAELRHGLDELKDQLAASAKQDLEAIGETQKHLKARELKALLARQAPQAQDLLTAMEAGLKDQAAADEAVLKDLERGSARLAADLEELQKRLGGRTA